MRMIDYVDEDMDAKDANIQDMDAYDLVDIMIDDENGDDN